MLQLIGILFWVSILLSALHWVYEELYLPHLYYPWLANATAMVDRLLSPTKPIIEPVGNFLASIWSIVIPWMIGFYWESIHPLAYDNETVPLVALFSVVLMIIFWVGNYAANESLAALRTYNGAPSAICFALGTCIGFLVFIASVGLAFSFIAVSDIFLNILKLVANAALLACAAIFVFISSVLSFFIVLKIVSTISQIIKFASRKIFRDKPIPQTVSPNTTEKEHQSTEEEEFAREVVHGGISHWKAFTRGFSIGIRPRENLWKLGPILLVFLPTQVSINMAKPELEIFTWLALFWSANFVAYIFVAIIGGFQTLWLTVGGSESSYRRVKNIIVISIMLLLLPIAGISLFKYPATFFGW